MNIFALLIITMVIILVLMRRHWYTGLCMLAGGLFLWLMRSLDPGVLAQSFMTTVLKPRSYDLIGAL